MSVSKRKIRKLCEALRIRGCWAEAERFAGLPPKSAWRYSWSRPEVAEARQAGLRALDAKRQSELERAARDMVRAELKLRAAAAELAKELARFSWGEVAKRERELDLLAARFALAKSRERRLRRRRAP